VQKAPRLEVVAQGVGGQQADAGPRQEQISHGNHDRPRSEPPSPTTRGRAAGWSVRCHSAP